MVSSHIVVVDDDDGVRRALVRLLEAGGHEVVAFVSAEEMLASEEYRSARCVILDIRLPGLSGLDLGQRLAIDGCATHVIYLTGHDDPAVRERAARQGAAFFLKPVERVPLLAAVARALGRT